MNTSAQSWFRGAEQPDTIDEMYNTGQFWTEDMQVASPSHQPHDDWTQDLTPTPQTKDVMYDSRHPFGFFHAAEENMADDLWPASPPPFRPPTGQFIPPTGQFRPPTGQSSLPPPEWQLSEGQDEAPPLSLAETMVNTWSEAQWHHGTANMEFYDSAGFQSFPRRAHVGPEGWWDDDEDGWQEEETWELALFKSKPLTPPTDSALTIATMTDWPLSPMYPSAVPEGTQRPRPGALPDLSELDLHHIFDHDAGPLRPPSSPWASDVVTLSVTQDSRHRDAPKRKRFPLPLELTSIDELRYESLQADPHAPPEVNNFLDTATPHSLATSVSHASMASDLGAMTEFLDSYWIDDSPTRLSPDQRNRAAGKKRARQASDRTQEWS